MSKKPSIYDKLTDASKYTGAHKERFDTGGRGKASGSRPHTVGTSAKKPSKTSIYDKLTDSSQYTGAHKERFDGSGKGVGLEKDKVFVSETDDGTTGVTKPKAQEKFNFNGGAPPTAASKSPKTPSKKSAGGGSIFDKLTDSSQYTGAHKERFDSDGQGRGKSGRTDSRTDTGYVQGFKNAKHLV
eukprot:m51a1_g12417 putative p25-alpha family protein (185) ;mRNA; f:739490-740463